MLLSINEFKVHEVDLNFNVVALPQRVNRGDPMYCISDNQ